MAGSVAWTTGNNAQLAGTGCEPVDWKLNVNADEFETTPFAATDPISTYLKGLYSWDFEFTTTLKVAEIGALGLVTFSAGYVTNLNAWTMEIERAAHEVTAFGATCKAYIPGRYMWSGTFGGFLDDTTAATLPANSNEPATGTFRYSERGATDAELSGSIFTKQLNVESSPRDVNKVSYGYRGSGALSQSASSSGVNIFSATGAIVGTAADTVTLTATTSRTYSGSAFWKGISISVGATGLTEIRVRGQGSGSLSVA